MAEDPPTAPAVRSGLGLSPSEARWCSIRLSKTRVISSSSSVSAAACESSPLSLSCQLCSEDDPLDAGGEPVLSVLPAAVSCATASAASLTLLSTLIRAHSVGADTFCVQSGIGGAAEGVVPPVSDGVCALLKAMLARSASEGVVGGVWKKSRGEPEREREIERREGGREKGGREGFNCQPEEEQIQKQRQRCKKKKKKENKAAQNI